MLIDVFATPLRKASELPPEQVRPGLLSSALEFTRSGVPKVQITKAEAKVIFHELDSLAAINQLLLEQLEERYAEWSPAATVGDIFLSIMSFLKGSVCPLVSRALLFSSPSLDSFSFGRVVVARPCGVPPGRLEGACGGRALLNLRGLGAVITHG